MRPYKPTKVKFSSCPPLLKSIQNGQSNLCSHDPKVLALHDGIQPATVENENTWQVVANFKFLPKYLTVPYSHEAYQVKNTCPPAIVDGCTCPNGCPDENSNHKKTCPLYVQKPKTPQIIPARKTDTPAPIESPADTIRAKYAWIEAWENDPKKRMYKSTLHNARVNMAAELAALDSLDVTAEYKSLVTV
jgi:hypothetical protein